jgi:hypothetical protein
VVVAVVSAIILGGIGTAVGWALHYAHAAPLKNEGGIYGFAPPDNLATRDVDLGPYHGLVARMRPNQYQSFYVNIWNDASVSQTVVGLAQDVLYEKLAIASQPNYGVDEFHLHYDALPVTLAPHSMATFRITVHSPRCSPGADPAIYWEDLPLRVRVGWFTRTENVRLDNIFELKASC